eukprot:TCONS_00024097-protein
MLFLLFLFLGTVHAAFVGELLKEQNKLRAVHGSSELQLNDELTRKAEQITKQAALKGEFGETSNTNTEMVCSTFKEFNVEEKAKDIVQAWYGEVCNKGFSFSDPSKGPSFTRMIHKDNYYVGIAKASNENPSQPCTFITAIYKAKEGDQAPNYRDRIEHGKFESSYCQESRRKKRSIYYRFPARFVIDSATGQTKSITPLQKGVPNYGQTGGTSQLSLLQKDTLNYARSIPQRHNSGFLPRAKNDNKYQKQTFISRKNKRFNSSLDDDLITWTPNLHGNTGSRRSGFGGSWHDQNLEAHNVLRKLHGSAAMTVDATMSASAQAWAERMASMGKLEHAKAGSPDNPEKDGENIAYMCLMPGEKYPGQRPVKMWYNEVCDPGYTFNPAPPFGGMAGHFTQVVWKISVKLGIGMAEGQVNGDKCIFSVGRYREAGNYGGKFEENVKQGSFNKATHCAKGKIDELLGLNEKGASIAGGGGAANTASAAAGGGGGNTPAPGVIPTGASTDPAASGAATGGGGSEPGEQKPAEGANIDAAASGGPTTGAGSAAEAAGAAGAAGATAAGGGNVPNSDGNVASGGENPAAGTPPGNGPGEAVPSKLKDEALEAHNTLRRIHGSSSMTYDDVMAKAAESVAVSNAKIGKLEHSKDLSKFGENLAYSCDPNGKYCSVRQSIKQWYMEACPSEGQQAYDFANQPGAGIVSHFTQVVWAESTKLGCGSAIGKMGGMTCIFYACRYEVKGNKDGKYATNVKKGEFDAGKTCPSINQILHIEAGPGSPSSVPSTSDNAVAAADGGNTGAGSPPKNDGGNNGAGGGGAASQMDKDQEVYQTDCLKVINRFRKIHMSPYLIADVSLHTSAKKMADTLVSGGASKEELKKKLGKPGAGLYQITCSPDDQVLPPDDAMVNWYRELCFKVPDFDFKSEEALKKAPHFTQMVWRSSTKIGIAYATKLKPKSKTLCSVIVAKFDPAGNTEGELAKNVDQGSFDRSFCGSLHSIASAAMERDAPSTSTTTTEPQAVINPGPVVTPSVDGTTPDGSPIKKPCSEPKINADGTVTQSDGSIKKPDGTVVKTDGSVTKPDGSVVNPDGSVSPPGSAPSTPDGATVSPDGSVTNQPGAGVTSGEEPVVKPDGSVSNPDGSTVNPDGSVVKADGGKVKANEAAKKPNGQMTTTEEAKNSGGGLALSSFDAEGLAAHNKFRSIHGANALRIDTQLSRDCQEYAKVLAGLGTLKHASGDFGENLAFKCGSDLKDYPGEMPVIAWYEEVCNPGYTFGSSEPASGTLHFTQLVWRATTDLGMGVAQTEKDGMTCFYAVARYRIRGNMGGEYVDNVKKGTFAKSMCDDLKGVLRKTKDPNPASVDQTEGATTLASTGGDANEKA